MNTDSVGRVGTAPRDATNGAASRRSALILYGSETGNSQDVAEEIGRLTTRLHFDTVVLDLDSIDLRDLVKHTVVIIAISTTGQGEFPQNARAFWRVLLSNRLRSGILRRMNFTTFGLGDSSYPRYNVVHRMLHGRLLQLGAQLFCQRGEGNEQHPEGHGAELRTWILDLRDALEQHFPLPDGVGIIAEDVFIEPDWRLEQYSSIDDSSQDVPLQMIADKPDESLIPMNGSHQAHLVANERITPIAHFQDVRLMDLVLEGDIHYGPGAVAVLYPKNFPADVQSFIESQNWQRIADIPVTLVPTKTGRAMLSPSPLHHVSLESTTTLRKLLTNHLDMLSIPRRSFFAGLVYFTKTGNEDEQYQKERILELANPELIDELWDYTTRPRRTILEVMPDFPSVKIPWQYACTVLPIMRGRQFSIASGGSLKTTLTGEGAMNDSISTKVQLLVAIADPPNPIIKYRKRYGVCTRYISTLNAGQRLNIGMQPGYLSVSAADYNVPMIMISPGTGLAPMRNLIYDRLKCAEEGSFDGSDQPLQDCLLFFGCRDRSADFFFEKEWKELESQGLQTFLALSRDKSAPRRYVQDLVVEQADLVFEALHDKQGKIYVCGSSGNMPKGVREALVQVIRTKLGSDEDTAETYLAGLEKQGRYKQETW